MANHIALRRIEADADSEPHQPDTIHATNRSNTMQVAKVIKTIFFILVPIQVSPPSHSASEQVTKSKGRPGGDLAQQIFELSEHLLDRIEVGRIGRQIAQLGAGSLDSQHDDGNAGGCPLCGESTDGPRDGDQLDLELKQLGDHLRSTIIATRGEAPLNDDVITFNKAVLAQPF
jgi:hypothetical protein